MAKAIVADAQRSYPAPDEPPHACMNGVVYVGRMVEDEHGDEVEVFEGVTCRHCVGER